LSIFTAGDRQL